MKSFLSQVVSEIITKHSNFQNLNFVLPSRRACVFLKEEFLNQLSKSTFLPQIFSIEDYIQELADINLIDNTQLLFEFYTVFKECTANKNDCQSFEVFAQWASIALSDFNEIDSYLVNTRDFFGSLKDIKKLNLWFKEQQPSNLAIDYLKFFDTLDIYYKALYKKLKVNKMGYQGLIYREATENLEFYTTNNNNYFTYFIGFNALNKAEEHIFQSLLQQNLAAVYWDADALFLDKKNEAGTFLRKYAKEWAYYAQNNITLQGNGLNSKREIQIIGAPKNIAQIKYAGEILSQVTNFSKTALVLGDEKLLEPTLNSLPNNVSAVNITMGCALAEIPLAVLFENIFKLYLNQEKFNKKSINEFYFKDVLNVLNDSFLNKINSQLIQKIVIKIKTQNKLFLSLNELKSDLSPTEITKLDFVFMPFQLPADVNSIISICITLINNLKEMAIGVEKEYFFRFLTVFQQLQTLNKKYNHISTLKALYLLYDLILKNEKLSFKGEPLQGLQLMGMLETRVLDFETVIITSVNEGILPGSKNNFSFIPFDVKKHFELPTYQEKDAIFSYHFQRLLLRANKVFLIYNTETDGYGSGEKSRFLTQLQIKYNLPKEIVVAPLVVTTEKKPITINKTPQVLLQLKNVFTTGISPSSLTNYLYNPINFYQQNILKITDVLELEETIEANTMGTTIHEVLKNMYQPFENKELTVNAVNKMLANYSIELQRQYEKIYKKGTLHYGKNKLIFEVSKYYLKRFLNDELEFLKQGNNLKILAIERKFETVFKGKNLEYPIKIKGTVDRIDLLNNVVRIIDYKTGKVTAVNLKLDNFAAIKSNVPKYGKVLQIMLYAFLFGNQKEFENHNSMEAGIVSFKNLQSGFLKLNFTAQRNGLNTLISKEIMNEFLEELEIIIQEILNPEIPFEENLNAPF